MSEFYRGKNCDDKIADLERQLKEAKLCPNGKDHSKEYCDPCTDYRINREYELCIVKNKEIESLQQQLQTANERIEELEDDFSNWPDDSQNQYCIVMSQRNELTQLRQENERLKLQNDGTWNLFNLATARVQELEKLVQRAKPHMEYAITDDWDEGDTLLINQWLDDAKRAVGGKE